jgi:ubiquinone/menaquinone biosynthesis C-methylase UbiE
MQQSPLLAAGMLTPISGSKQRMSHTVQTIRGSGRRFVAVPARSEESELMDEAQHDPSELAANLRDIRRVNQLLGGTATTLHHLPALVAAIPAPETITLLDLGTGSGDIPVALVKWAAKHRRTVRIVASDYSRQMLDIARDHVSPYAEITLEQYDARNVPLPDNSFDIVLCSLSLHHFSPDEAVQVLREMNRLASIGFILNDLRRSRIGYFAAWIAGRLTTRNRLTRNDAPLSMLRAYTPTELKELLQRAGVHDATVSTHRWFRMAAVRGGAPHHA